MGTVKKKEESKISQTTKQNDGFALEKNNYILLLIGLAIIIVGFMLMAGGKSEDPNVFNQEIFSFRRITLAPILVMGGFMFEIYAILKKPQTPEETEL
jgi:membrane-bound ClpP family serine protease